MNWKAAFQATGTILIVGGLALSIVTPIRYNQWYVLGSIFLFGIWYTLYEAYKR